MKVLIVGLGLIGGSIAKNIKYKRDDVIVYGYDVNNESIDYALQHNIIDDEVDSFVEGVQKCNIIFLATPIYITLQYMDEFLNIPLQEEKIVTDVSSVKGPVIEKANELTGQNNFTFVGGHPMAGSHKQGIEAARSHLFENAFYVLTPSNSTEQHHIDTLKRVLSETKSYFIELNSTEHDKMTGVVSHFPHLIASSLVHQARKWGDHFPFISQLAAGGFRDITRIASSNPFLWQDIFFQNKEKLTHLLSDWIDEMVAVKQMIENEEKDKVVSYLTTAKDYRDGLPKRDKGAIPAFYDLYIDIYDKPGELYKVFKLMADEEINVTNTQIHEIRENMTGVLRITVQTEDEKEKAIHLLHHNKYEVFTDEQL
ncbi:prephenate dehydrogenase [Salirhabdus salicampi]|uniref:prephenate dehydrogenase n=1 Tax=Salirhabdus salicampi TaxID=476102 RepID=UPI0020C470FF|nr:prephenate dehydrogenase [Salirhabdus salicampi]MCP8616695.1 prephenate dehydrogenase [Salirhabdus salicampi]